MSKSSNIFVLSSAILVLLAFVASNAAEIGRIQQQQQKPFISEMMEQKMVDLFKMVGMGKMEEGKKDDLLCATCVRDVIQSARIMFSQGRQIMDFVVLAICPQMTDYAKQCQELVKKDLGGLLEKINEQFKDPKAYCQKMHLC